MIPVLILDPKKQLILSQNFSKNLLTNWKMPNFNFELSQFRMTSDKRFSDVISIALHNNAQQSYHLTTICRKFNI